MRADIVAVVLVILGLLGTVFGLIAHDRSQRVATVEQCERAGGVAAIAARAGYVCLPDSLVLRVR